MTTFLAVAVLLWVLYLTPQFVIWWTDRRQGRYYPNVLVWLDAGLNTLAFGHPHNTISGRVGYYSNIRGWPYWRTLEIAIDWAFKPIDGPGHCRQVMLKTRDQHYEAGGYFWLALLGIGVLMTCPLIRPITMILANRKR